MTTIHDDVARVKLHALFERARTVMLLSLDGVEIHGRPMAVIRVDEDETMYFTTDMKSEKLAELGAHPHVSIAVQARGGYAMLQGVASIVHDRALIDDLWKDSWKVWYPRGRADPALAIIVVAPTHATFWDQSFERGLSYLFRYLRARVTGSALAPESKDQTEMALGHHPA